MAFKEKPYDSNFKMPKKEEIVKKAKELLIQLFGEKEDDTEDLTEDETSDTETDFKSKMMLAMKKEMAAPKIPKSKRFENLEFELANYYKSYGETVTDVGKLNQALLSIKPSSASSERAFSISGTYVTKRRARLGNSVVDDLCFSKDFLQKSQND